MRGGSEQERLKAPSPVDVLRKLVFGLAESVDQPSAAPLVVGYLRLRSARALRAAAPRPGDPIGWPDFEFWLPDRLVWLDHQRGMSTIVAHLFGGEHASSAYGDAVSAIVRLVQTVEETERRAAPRGRWRTDCAAVSGQAQTPDTDMDDEAYAAVVARLKEHIVAGDVFQIVPSRTFSRAVRRSAGGLSRAARARIPARTCSFSTAPRACCSAPRRRRP